MGYYSEALIALAKAIKEGKEIAFAGTTEDVLNNNCDTLSTKDDDCLKYISFDFYENSYGIVHYEDNPYTHEDMRREFLSHKNLLHNKANETYKVIESFNEEGVQFYDTFVPYKELAMYYEWTEDNKACKVSKRIVEIIYE